MPNIEVEGHIHIIATCNDCGYSWDVEDYDSPTVEVAIAKAEDEEVCPKCQDE